MAYVGIPGSGKSYEVVSSVILAHFKKGRRIVTNIEGITHQKLIDWLAKYEPKFDLSLAGQLIHVNDEDCQDDSFFPYKGSDSTLCRAGDLICLDEIWRIFPTDKIKDNHRSFVAEHRHFTCPDTGICCDLVVINQSVTGIPRFIKDRIETTFLMSRLVALGLAKRYRVNVYSGAKTTKTMLVTQFVNKYDKRIFELYKSFDGVNGQTKSIDDRQNYFRSPQFKLSIVAIISFFGFAYYMLSDYINVATNSSDSVDINQQLKSPVSSAVGETVSKEIKAKQASNRLEELKTNVRNAKTPMEQLLARKQLFAEIPQILSQKWRIVGELNKDDHKLVILSDDKGNLRLEPLFYFEGKGRELKALLGGEVVSYYSGGKEDVKKVF